MTEEDRIRDTYRAYETGGRDRLWNRSNRGFARLIQERDLALQDLFARSLPGGPARVLDVGSGDGTLIGRITARWPDVQGSGLDLLADKIDVAHANVPEATFHVGSADAMPFDDASFDVVAAITLLSSIPSASMEEAAAREIGRVLVPGGWVVWYDLRYDNPSNPAVHGISRRRLAKLFPGWRAEVRSLTLAPPIARRLGPLTPIGYPLLHAVPPLRSHLIGRLRCPT